MKHQRGISLSGLIFWCIVLALVAILGMKVVPTLTEYYKIRKDVQTVAAQAAPDATVADIRKAFDKFVEVDNLTDFKSSQLDIYKNNLGQITIDFDYERRVQLLDNVSLVIRYKGSSAK
ncbi:DUF4845 domain-containing protein [Azonexus sp. R2A61]|uniref:DUF4845 domain-containing protein n=1 Tax=Azonexus sp. R2A61 TaxID=2744443 RepID=UPI001F38D749|nr:DUF4845 domain-containing protein [Azonexus sp. R2A61]